MVSPARVLDGWITPSRLRGYPIVFATLGVMVFVGIWATGNPSDHLAHWTGGRLILDGDGSMLYDRETQRAVQDGMVTGDGVAWFVSPPFVAYLYAPFALFDYQTAAALWAVFSASCMVAAAWLVRPFAPRLFRDHSRVVYVALFSTWPVFDNLVTGQEAGVSVLLWVAGLRLLMAGRDAAGGAVLALGLMKPQLFFVVPFVLIAQRRWRALGAWAATCAGLGLVSIQAVGVQGVIDWIGLPFSDAFHDIVQTSQAWRMQSLPALAESIGLERVGLLVAAVGLTVLLWQIRNRSDVDHVAMWMLAIVATFAVTPHVLSYDLLVLLVPVLWLLEHHNTRQVRLSCLALFILLWTFHIRHAIGAPFDWAWSAVPIVVLWLAVSRQDSLSRSRHATPSDQSATASVLS